MSTTTTCQGQHPASTCDRCAVISERDMLAPKEAFVAETRTYETFQIVWDRGSRWTGYDTAAEAQATLDFARSPGRIERHAFTVEVPAERAHLYRTGI